MMGPTFVFAGSASGTLEIGLIGTLQLDQQTIKSQDSSKLPLYLLAVGSAGVNLYSAYGDDVIVGNSGNNRINGGGGQDVMTGGAGNDTFIYDFLAGGAESKYARPDTITDFTTGSDRLEFAAVVPNEFYDVTIVRSGSSSTVLINHNGTFQEEVIVNGAVNASDLVAGQNAALRNINVVTDHVDTIQGNSATVLGGTAGNDVIRGGSAVKSIFGFAGNDTIESGWNPITPTGGSSLGGGGPQPTSAGSNYVSGGDGDDVLSGGSFDLLDGGSGNDKITIGQAQPDPSPGIPPPFQPRFPVPSLGVIFGGDGDDMLTTYGNSTTIDGGAGNDTITLRGNYGDTLYGGSGADTFIFANATLQQTTVTDILGDFQTNIDQIQLPALGPVSIARTADGTFVFDAITVSGRATSLNLISTSDINGRDLIGLSTNVFFQGSAGVDTYIASSKGDLMLGGGGGDFLTGGAGGDTFWYSAASDSTSAGQDVLRSFQVSIDKIDLRLVHTGANDYFGIANNGVSSFVFVDLGGDGTNDMVIGVANITNLGLNDVLFG